MSIEIGIFGAGRFASAIAAEVMSTTSLCNQIKDQEQFAVSWMLHRGEAVPPNPVDVAIDASAGSAVREHLDWALKTKTPLVIGATGWNIPDIQEKVGDIIGVIISPNFSFAVAMMQRFAADMAKFSDWYGEGDLIIFEHHHSGKKDAPSGTARSIAGTIIGCSKRYHAWSLSGSDQNILPIASLRAGNEVGTHELIFDAPHERFSITHQSRDRILFAYGALKAAKWILPRKGTFYMNDMLDDLINGEENRNQSYDKRDRRFRRRHCNAV